MIDSVWRDVRRLLVVRLDNLGDVLLATPAVHAIKRSLPGVQITLLSSAVGAQAGRLNPDVDEVIEHEAPWVDPWSVLPFDPDGERQLIETIRERRFDAAVIFTSFRQSSLPAAYACYLAGIPLRLAASVDGPGSLLTSRHKHPDRMVHEVERGLSLVSAVGMCLEESERELVLEVPDIARQEIARTLREAGATASGPLVVLHPGCSMPARRYPWEMYSEVADLLVERLRATVALTGSADERELVEHVRARMNHDALNLVGDLSFAQLCALIESADVTVTNNTGPMHVSSALKTPVVALFALTNPPEQWGPWRVPSRVLYHDVPCRLCYSQICPMNQECLRRVSSETVLEAVYELLTERPITIKNRVRSSPDMSGAMI